MQVAVEVDEPSLKVSTCVVVHCEVHLKVDSHGHAPDAVLVWHKYPLNNDVSARIVRVKD